MARRTSDLHGGIQAAHQFDEGALVRYLHANVEGFPCSLLKFTVSQFGHGQSNPTFFLEAVGEGGSVKRYVLRKKPPGKILQSAHAIEREFLVLKALGSHTDVPVPKVFCLCTDASIIGTPFYIMEYLEGRIFLDSRLPGVSPERKRAIYEATAKTLAALHRVNVDVIGLGKFGRRDNYCKRQIERWEQQYLLSTGEGKPLRNPRMLDLAGWLKENIPLEDSSAVLGTGLVHGDFRIDNIVFHPKEDQVLGILDWELCTLGNQMCDVAYSTLHYIVDFSLSAKCGGESQTEESWIPPLAEYLSEYCNAVGRPWPAENWKFYVSFSLFRGASIYAGVYHRWTMGNASGGEAAKNAGKKSDLLIDTAWRFISGPRVLPDKPPSGGSYFPFLVSRNIHLANNFYLVSHNLDLVQVYFTGVRNNVANHFSESF